VNYINASMDIVCILVMLIVLYGLLFEYKEKTRPLKNKIYIGISFITTIGTIIDCFKYCINGNASSEIVLMTVGVLSIINSYIWIILASYYIIAFLRNYVEVSWNIAKIILVFNLCLILFTIYASRLLNLFYIQDGYFRVSAWYGFVGFSIIFSMLLSVFLCVRYNKYLRKHDMFVLILYSVLPLISLIIDVNYRGLSTRYLSQTLSVLLCYVIIQTQEIKAKNQALQHSLEESTKRQNDLLQSQQQEEEVRKGLEYVLNTTNEQLGIIHSLANIFTAFYYIDLREGFFTEFECNVPDVRKIIGRSGDAQEMLELMCSLAEDKAEQEEMLGFTGISTIADRLKDRLWISHQFYAEIFGGWMEGTFVATDKDEYGICTHVIWAIKDINEQKKADEKIHKELIDALRMAEAANNSKSEFLSRMSHDIRTPLNGIVGLLEIDERHPDDYELLKQNRAKSKIAANHLLSLISDVLELSKLNDQNVSLAHEAFSLSELANEILTITELRANESGIKIIHPQQKEYLPYPYVYGSPLHVRQIFINIFINAVKYNKTNGSVEYNYELVKHDDNIVTYKVTVKDTGIGMSKDFMDHIFEPFVQEHTDARSTYNGTGLGMAIVKSLVDKMNGTIEVESELDKGSGFTVILPFETATIEDLPKKLDEKDIKLDKCKILLVEDNELNMEIANEILKDMGALVTSAQNGKEALDIFTKGKEGDFDVIIMDVMMPVMDGYEATKKIRSINRNDAKTIPIIAMTANAFAEDAQKCLDCGMNAHIAKPINIKELQKKLVYLLK